MIKNDNEVRSFRFPLFFFFREEKFEIRRKARRPCLERRSYRKGEGEGGARHRYAGYPGHRKESETSINSYFGRTLDPVSCLTPSLGRRELERFGKSLEFYFGKNPPSNSIPLFAHPSLRIPSRVESFRERLRYAWLRST